MSHCFQTCTYYIHQQAFLAQSLIEGILRSDIDVETQAHSSIPQKPATGITWVFCRFCRYPRYTYKTYEIPGENLGRKWVFQKYCRYLSVGSCKFFYLGFTWVFHGYPTSCSTTPKVGICRFYNPGNTWVLVRYCTLQQASIL